MKKDSVLYRHFYHNRMLHKETQRESRVRENFTHGLVDESNSILYRKREFSLIELLIVMAVVAILTSLLQPSLEKIRLRSESLKCQSNLHQIGVAYQYYVDEYDGWLPSFLNL